MIFLIQTVQTRYKLSAHKLGPQEVDTRTGAFRLVPPPSVLQSQLNKKNIVSSS